MPIRSTGVLCRTQSLIQGTAITQQYMQLLLKTHQKYEANASEDSENQQSQLLTSTNQYNHHFYPVIASQAFVAQVHRIRNTAVNP